MGNMEWHLREEKYELKFKILRNKILYIYNLLIYYRIYGKQDNMSFKSDMKNEGSRVKKGQRPF